MKMPTIAVIACACLTLAVIAPGRATENCTGCGGDANQKATGKPGTIVGYRCPLWEVDYLPNGMVVYYCNRFDTALCTDTPSADYMAGHYNWPAADCSEDCEPILGERTRTPSEPEKAVYPGFDGRPKAHDYPGPELYGPAGRFCHILVDPKIPYIKQTGKEEYAKVFVFLLNISKAMGECGDDDRLQKMYVAYELESAPSNGAIAQESGWEPIDGADSHAFRTMLNLPDGKQAPLLILTAENNPET